MSTIYSIPPAFQSATTAIRQSVKSLDKDAQVVATYQSVDSRDTVAALIDARQQVLYTKVAARIITATDEIGKSLLDIKA